MVVSVVVVYENPSAAAKHLEQCSPRNEHGDFMPQVSSPTWERDFSCGCARGVSISSMVSAFLWLPLCPCGGSGC